MENIIDSRIKIVKERELGARASWDEYWMMMAINASVRSSCRHVCSGSVVINNKKEIRATGYNGASGKIFRNCLDAGCRKESKGLEYEKSLGSGDCIGIHSEMNALGHLSKIGGDELTLYTTILPCPDCAKNIQPYNIKRVVFKKPYSEKETLKSLDKLYEAEITVCQLDLSLERMINIYLNGQDSLTHGLWTPKERDMFKF